MSQTGAQTSSEVSQSEMENMVVSLHHEKLSDLQLADVSVHVHTAITEDLSESQSSFSCSGGSSHLSDLPGPLPLSPKVQPQHKRFNAKDGGEDAADADADTESGRIVRFARDTELHEIIHRLDYSTEEKSACWYLKSEFAAVRQEAQALVDLIENGAQIPDDDDLPSPRGLENFTLSGVRAAHLNHSLAIEAVLKEQVQQDLAGIYDDKAIAKMYRKVSLRGRFPARMKALQDQAEASGKSKSQARSLSAATFSPTPSHRLKVGSRRASQSHLMQV